MARRKKHDAHENHERWLVSYADFITLLFAFFVVMYANSNVDKAKAQQISESVRRALEDGRIVQALTRLVSKEPAKKSEHPLPHEAFIAPPPPDSEPNSALRPALAQLREQLKTEISAGRMDVRLENRGLVISLREATFFPSGGDVLEPSTKPMLAKVASAIAKLPHPIRMEGHTDSVPINTPRFRSNWDLSAARGIAMLELFQAEFGIARERMSIAGYAETCPVAPNTSEEGRARNRRVDIVVLNEAATSGEPVRGGASNLAATPR